jgi:NADH-quinone oxidoreductase subunit G
MIIIGDAALIRSDGCAILSLVHEIVQRYKIVRKDWNGFNILHNHASMVGALDIGFIYGESGDGTLEILKQSREKKIKLLYLLGADDFDMSLIDKDCFVVYQGHHGDEAAMRADVILPEAAYTEQDAIFVNMEGRPQYARRAVLPVGEARESWKIITLLAERLNLKISFSSLQDVRQLLAKENPVFANIDKVLPAEFITYKSSAKLHKNPIKKVPTNYYMTNSISRSSVTMAKCVQARGERG